MRFEKWQALGNDYVILDERDLPFELTPGRVQVLCAAHTGVGSDGVLLLASSDSPGMVGRVRIFNPDGSEAELSGNGVRQAALYMRANGWVDADSFSLDTAAGEIRPRITGPDTCAVDQGRARLRSADYPSGGEDGLGTVISDGREFAFQHVQVGNPQCAIEIREGLEDLDLGAIGPGIEGSALFPNRTNVSFWARTGGSAICARIFERGAGETLSSGTGATGAAIAAVVRGVDSPVRVVLDGGELEVEVGDDLHVTLSGWARQVYRGDLGARTIAELERTR